MKIIAVDPGQSDPFAIVLLELKNGKIFILGCKFYKNQEYEDVEQDIVKIYKDSRAERLVIEGNGPGKPVISTFRKRYNLSVEEMITKNKSSSEDSHTVDKSEMYSWLDKMNQEGKLKWPQSDTEFMKELKRQWTVFGEYKTGKYAAPTGDHDDLMMALMIGCSYLKPKVDNYQSKPIAINDKDLVDYHSDDTGGAIVFNDKDLTREETFEELNQQYEEGKTGLRWEVIE